MGEHLRTARQTTTIALIGPPGAGKSTLAPLLGHALALPVLDLDEQRWSYYAELGYDPSYAQQLVAEQGLPALVAYWKPFEIHAVERVIAAFPGHVIAFGAGHSYYEDPAQLRRAQQALAHCTHVILLLPSPDNAVSASCLAARFSAEDPQASAIRHIQATMLEHPANRTLATLTIYTLDKTPAEICSELMRQIAER